MALFHLSINYLTYLLHFRLVFIFRNFTSLI